MNQRMAKALGSLLGELRKEHGMTLRELSEMLHEKGLEISEATVQRVEIGRNMLRLDTARAIFQLLGIPLYQVDEIMVDAHRRGRVEWSGKTYEELRARGMKLMKMGCEQAALDYFCAAEQRLINDGQRDGDTLAEVIMLVADCRKRLRRLHLSSMSLTRLTSMKNISKGHRVHTVAQQSLVASAMEDFFAGRLHLEYVKKHMDGTTGTIRAYAYAAMGGFLHESDAHAEAVPHLEAARLAFEDMGKRHHANQVRVSLGFSLFKAGYRKSGMDMVRRVVEEERRSGHLGIIGNAYWSLGRMAVEQGRLAAARRSMREALAVAKRRADANVVFIGLFELWKLDRLEGRSEERHLRATMRRMLPRVDRGLPEAREFLKTLLPPEAQRPALRPGTTACR